MTLPYLLTQVHIINFHTYRTYITYIHIFTLYVRKKGEKLYISYSISVWIIS